MDIPIDIERLRAALRSHEVRFALVFGSHARGEAGPDSDVDLAVMCDGPVADEFGLRGALGEQVDLLDLATAPDSIAGRVALEGVVVLDDDPALRVRWQATQRKLYADEAPRRARFNRDFAEAHG